MTLHNAFNLGKLTVAKWNEHNAPRLAAALAYYSLLSLAPVVVVVVAIYGLAFTHGTAEKQFLNQVQMMLGYTGVNAIKALNDNLQHATNGTFAAILGGVLLVVGASSVFSELRDSLNTIWDAPPESGGVKEIVFRRIVSVALVVALGLLLLISVIVGVALHVVQTAVVQFLPADTAILGEIANLFISFLASAGLFALIFKVVPDVPIDWRDVGIGAVATAFLFTAGRALLALYFSKAAVGSAYGTAGSLVAFVVWIYYSAQIFLLGAVLTRVYARQYGSHSGTPIVEKKQKWATPGR